MSAPRKEYQYQYQTFDFIFTEEDSEKESEKIIDADADADTDILPKNKRHRTSPVFRDLEDVPESHMTTAGSSNHILSSQTTFRVTSGMEKAKEHNTHGIILPWNTSYKAWWGLTVFAAAITIFFETFMIAFPPSKLVFAFTGHHYRMEYLLTAIFVTDVLVNFRLAFYDHRDAIVLDPKAIARHYRKSNIFWVDILAVFPFDYVSVFVSGHVGEESNVTNYLALFRLSRLLRIYRLRDFFEMLQYDTRISLFGLTMIRNFAAALVWTHLGACTLYFVSKQTHARGLDTFLGQNFETIDEFDSYTTTLYWSVVTFATVGYGDFSPANSSEQLLCVVYMMSNIVIQAWIIGSITLLLIKKDEKTGHYRDTLETLDQYSKIHDFDKPFRKRLEDQVRLDFHTREIADESVLHFFPISTRRRVLRRLYGPFLANTELLKGVRQQFVDAFLSLSCVEIFSPGEEILRRNAVSSDLYLLVGGVVRCGSSSSSGGGGGGGNCRVESQPQPHHHYNNDTDQKAGDFINEIGFFTESPQIDTVTTVTVCKTLTISRSSYKLLAQDHPGSSGKILQNLLDKVQKMDDRTGVGSLSDIPVSIEYLRAGSMYFERSDSYPEYRRNNSVMSEESSSCNNNNNNNKLVSTQTAVEDLVKMHIEKQKDDHTTRFLFAASRGDINTISIMCDQGFDPNRTDYDSRSALMVASMKGNTEVVEKLLGYDADPNLVDMHGSSALYEASRNGHEDTMEALLAKGARLCMSDSLAASVLDQAVFDGNILLLRRLLMAKIQVDASDYDKRGAVHLAAAEGNLAALKVLVEFGADLTARDRWGNSVEDEAKRAEAGRLLAYLRSLKDKT
jgi:ankyrin repeat protein